MPYQIVDGHDNEGTLADVTLQPASPIVEAGRVRVAGDTLSYADGFETAYWAYEDLLPNSDYETLLTEFGVSAAESNEVTVRTYSRGTRTFANYNAVIRKPLKAKYKEGFWRNVVFELTLIEAL